MTYRMYILLHIAFWLLMLTLHVAVLNAFLPGNMIGRPLVNQAFLILIFYVNALVLVDLLLEKKRYWAYFILVNLLVLATVPIRMEINGHLMPARPNREWALLFGALATGYGMAMLSTIYQMLVNRNAAERRALAWSNSQTEAQLQLLRAQINPHFLFNTLNNIYSLALTRSEQTAPMVLKLSQLLRYVVYEAQNGEKSSLAREVEHIRQFVDLFRMRSEEPLDISMQVEGPAEEVFIEPVILLPLVENCFKHCDFETNPNAFVRIRLAIAPEEVVFETVNSKNAANQQKNSQGGVGLENIRRRMEWRYPGRYALHTRDKWDTFEVYFRIQTN